MQLSNKTMMSAATEPDTGKFLMAAELHTHECFCGHFGSDFHETH